MLSRSEPCFVMFYLDLSVRQSVGPFFGAAQLFFLICRSGSLSGHFSEQHWWLPWSMVHSVRADPSLNTVLCGGLKPYACARFGGTHGAVDVTSSRLQVPGPKSSIVGFGALRSPSCFIFGWLRPKTLQLPFPRWAAASQTYRLMPRAFASQIPSSLFWRFTSQTARFVLGTLPPGLPCGGGGWA